MLAANVASTVPLLFKWKLTLVPAPSMVNWLTVSSGSAGGGPDGAMFQPIASKAVKSAAEIGSTTPGVP